MCKQKVRRCVNKTKTSGAQSGGQLRSLQILRYASMRDASTKKITLQLDQSVRH